jgi:aspartyl-tRNA(Asn)/glutamyl-tRNA(Gln) amidotransferase subunit A
VAAGLCVASVGTDTGGSIRIPAALCGIVGLKPTFGRVSVHGVFPLAPSFDHVGTLARSVADAVTLLSVISGRDRHDPASVAAPRLDWHAGKTRGKKKIRLGVPREHFWTWLDPQVRRLAEAAVNALVKQGAVVEEISLPATPSAVDAATTVALVEARRVHERAGYFPARAAEYAPDGRERLEQGGHISAVEFLQAQDVLACSKREFEAALRSVDAIVTPTTPIAAPPMGAESVRFADGDESVRSALVRLNRPGSYTGLPAISVPCGFTSEGLPVGLQLIGRAFGEAELAIIADRYERSQRWRSSHPKVA